MVYRRRRAPKRVMRKRRNQRRYRNKARTNTGLLRIVRKCPEITLQNSGVLGGYTISDPTPNGMLASSGVGVATGFLGTYDIPFSMKFSLNQIINSSEITAIADKYKLVKTVVKIYFNSNQVSVNGVGSLPQFTYMTDADDVAIPTVAQVREKMGAKIKYFNSKNYMTIMLYPKPTAEVYGSSVFTAYSPGFKGWLDCNSPQIEHYGLKGVFQNVYLPTSAAATGFKWDVTHTIIAKDLQ